MTEGATADPPGVTAAIVAFLNAIGIATTAGRVEGETPLPGIAIRDGALIYDAARLAWPGDLLHEAGHVAVADPAVRPTLREIESDGGDEMAAIAWSYAAARAIGMDARTVFHEGGYRGGGYLADAFEGGGNVGLPMLQWFGMANDAKTAAAQGTDAYPAMLRWLR